MVNEDQCKIVSWAGNVPTFVAVVSSVECPIGRAQLGVELAQSMLLISHHGGVPTLKP